MTIRPARRARFIIPPSSQYNIGFVTHKGGHFAILQKRTEGAGEFYMRMLKLHRLTKSIHGLQLFPVAMDVDLEESLEFHEELQGVF